MTLSPAERNAMRLINERPCYLDQLPEDARKAVPALKASGLISTKGKCLHVTDAGEALMKAGTSGPDKR